MEKCIKRKPFGGSIDRKYCEAQGFRLKKLILRNIYVNGLLGINENMQTSYTLPIQFLM